VSPELDLAIKLATPILTILVGALGWALRRSIQDIDAKLTAVETDVRQLASQGARHGESLAAGVQQFKNIEKRLDRLEDRVLGSQTVTGSFHLQSGGP
jgi:Tfp pilus assembly protein PilO